MVYFRFEWGEIKSFVIMMYFYFLGDMNNYVVENLCGMVIVLIL